MSVELHDDSHHIIFMNDHIVLSLNKWLMTCPLWDWREKSFPYEWVSLGFYTKHSATLTWCCKAMMTAIMFAWYGLQDLWAGIEGLRLWGWPQVRETQTWTVLKCHCPCTVLWLASIWTPLFSAFPHFLMPNFTDLHPTKDQCKTSLLTF